MDIKALQAEFRGEIFTPGSAVCEVARRIRGALIDRGPTATVRCLGPAGVRAAFRFSVDQGTYPAQEPEAEHKLAEVKCCDRLATLSLITALLLD
jgi:hypothetical protein